MASFLKVPKRRSSLKNVEDYESNLSSTMLKSLRSGTGSKLSDQGTLLCKWEGKVFEFWVFAWTLHVQYKQRSGSPCSLIQIFSLDEFLLILWNVMFRVVCRHKNSDLIVLLTGPKNKNHHKSTELEDDSVTRQPFLFTRETAVRLNRTIAKKKKRKTKNY